MSSDVVCCASRDFSFMMYIHTSKSGDPVPKMYVLSQHHSRPFTQRPCRCDCNNVERIVGLAHKLALVKVMPSVKRGSHTRDSVRHAPSGPLFSRNKEAGADRITRGSARYMPHRVHLPACVSQDLPKVMCVECSVLYCTKRRIELALAHTHITPNVLSRTTSHSMYL